MDVCPHCGEPIEDDDESCRHCGSDFETGWRPDVDYHSLDLPEDDLETEHTFRDGETQPIWQLGLSWGLVAVSGVLFLAASFIAYPKSVMPFVFVVLLTACWVVFHRKIAPRKRRD